MAQRIAMHVAHAGAEVKRRRDLPAQKAKRRPANGTAFLMNLWDFSESRLKA
jgi:hypothetical protein